jgi:hypothetical protein
MLDLGFIWFFIKSMRDPFLIVMWVFCMVRFENAEDGPAKNIYFAVSMFGLGYVIVTLGASIIKDKYKEYRAQQEAAWNLLKDSK